MQSIALLRLLHLASPSLPVGAYTYSQGLEAAIEMEMVKDEASARAWIAESLAVVADFEAPILWRLLQGFSTGDLAVVTRWTERFIAARDTIEFRAETIQMGYSLGKLVMDLKIADESLLGLMTNQPEIPLPTAFACAAEALAVPHEAALLGYLFSMIENQVLVCVKSVPLGQVLGQRLLLSLHSEIEAAAHGAQRLEDDELSNWAPGLSLLSMQHEVQYSRVYRS
ncbi:urease accessory protein [Nitrosomonas cryotolerans]|uniref:Urease accessory protein UreF n=1 Tax=Nitrosomonas cryotolerans ATCC 49181 TaxID=1131553 RepID=A0A1N6HWS4_9PROT|nr:urease accessory UreF family protein [Nitrosomonas cryotolerans]SFP69447.1 urease accessory protein [Nitrosomonas cryotolerans]SIO24298.1 urease accessory protein [Nitrosomonas cryotolerans ATCC 49181]